MERCIAALGEKNKLKATIPSKSRVEVERNLASIILKATADMYQVRRSPAVGSVSSAKGFTLLRNKHVL